MLPHSSLFQSSPNLPARGVFTFCLLLFVGQIDAALHPERNHHVSMELAIGNEALVSMSIKTPSLPKHLEMCMLSHIFGHVAFKDESGIMLYELLELITTGKNAWLAAFGNPEHPDSSFPETETLVEWIACSVDASACSQEGTPHSMIACGFSDIDVPGHKILVVTTDYFSPYNSKDKDIEATIKALQGAGVTLIGLTTGSVSNSVLDTLASETGGSVHELARDAANIGDVILDALHSLPVDVTAELSDDTPGCSVLTIKGIPLVGRDEDPVTVKRGGEDMDFKETITVVDQSPGASIDAGTTITCRILFKASGVLIDVQTIEITVPCDGSSCGSSVTNLRGANNVE